MLKPLPRGYHAYFGLVTIATETKMYEEESEQVVGSYAIYFAEGDNLAKKKEFKKAIDAFTKALEFQPDDRACLIARSKCYLQLGDANEALKDAETSLKEDNKFHGGLYRKAEALYRMGNFEHALVFYHRGNKIRPDLEEFILGIQKAQEAIANSIGTPEGCKLEKTGDLSFFKQQDTVGKKKPTKGQKAAQQQIKARLGPVATERTMKELLGELYIDYDYLEKLSKDAEIGNTDDTIYGLIHSGMSYLDARAEFWRQQKPMYTRKREKELKKWKPPPTRPQNPSRNTRSNREQDPIDHAKFAIKSIEEIDNSLSSGDAEKSLFQGEQAMMTVQSLTEAELPNKMQFIATLHSCIGNAHLELGHVDVALEHFEKDMQIATEEDYVEAKGRAFFNLGKAYTIMGNYDEGIKYWLKRIPLLKSSEEGAWLYHEIGRGYWEMDKFEEAKEYGIKSLNLAHDSNDQHWQLNAEMLIAQTEVKLGDLSGALSSFKNCLDIANIIGDTTTADGIKKAMEDVNTQIVSSLQQQTAKSDENDNESTSGTSTNN